MSRNEGSRSTGARLKRSKPLAKGKPLQASTALRSAPTRSKKQVHPDVAREVYKRQKGLCICGCGKPIAEGPIGLHHVLPKARFPELAQDPRNIVGVTAKCHANHESAYRRLKRYALAPIVASLLTTAQRRSYFRRTYG